MNDAEFFASENKEDDRIREIIRTELNRLQFIGVRGIRVSAKDGKIIIADARGEQTAQETSTQAEAAEPTGPFFQMYEDEVLDTYLLGGTVTGGHGGTATIADFKVLDATTGPDTNANKVLYIRANATATVEDGLMLPGLLLNSAELISAATGSPPSNHTFTVSAPTGNLHVEIGRWTDTNFYPSGPGHAHASGWIGNYQLARTT
jgi:hypothetical protein